MPTLFKNREWKWVVTAASIFLLIALLAQTGTRDGIRGLVLSSLFKDTTVYAPQFDEDVFRNIRIGADTTTVRKVLGEPLERDVIQGLERWRYSKSSSDSHYRVRQISFEQGRVISKSAYFLVD